MKPISILFAAVLGLVAVFSVAQVQGAENGASTVPLSKETKACIDCHSSLNPGLVQDWLASRHAKTTPDAALKKPEAERRMSAQAVPEALRTVAVGCYECHSLNPGVHKDNFVHADYKINVVVSPNDCKTCHTTEADQYGEGKKANALSNLDENPIFHALVNTVSSVKRLKGTQVMSDTPSASTLNETCYGCHGSRVTVKGLVTRATDVGDMQFPELANWPNQGVGRGNPDGSSGACTSCHPRHRFAISVARQPYTCGQCHIDPDVPAWNVYQESKHGNIFFSSNQAYNLDNVPWAAGRDFIAPTCATCHNSLVSNIDGSLVAERNHNFGARPWVRIFGLIYSHPQPRSGKTYLLKNRDGLPLPTTFTGEPASTFLIDREEQAKRQDQMQKICQSCHSGSFIKGHFADFDASVQEADEMVKTATLFLSRAWDMKLADKANPFDEPLEQKWVRQWLFYANSVRFGAAMMGHGQATFREGWWDLTANLAELAERMKTRK
jgi:hypothetical protein